jgi:hypothetical protein
MNVTPEVSSTANQQATSETSPIRSHVERIGGLSVTSFSEIEREHVQWLWPDRVPLGMLSLLIGDPGLGKSLLTCWLAAEVSRAGRAVLVATAEDSPSVIVRPRLEAVEAELDLIHLVEMRRDGCVEGIALPDDVARLDVLVADYRAQLVVIDPLMAHLPDGVNSWRDQSVRRALAPLARMAAERGCAVIVVAHLNKATGSEPLYRAGGSVGIPAAARSVLLMARDPDDTDGERGSRRIVAHVKCNVAPQAESLSCAVEPVLLDGDGRIETARLTITGTSEISGTELLRAVQDEERTEADEAADFLAAELADGPQPATRLIHEATCSKRTLHTVKKKLGIEAYRESVGNGGAGHWVWRMPTVSKDASAGFRALQSCESAQWERADDDVEDASPWAERLAERSCEGSE